MKIKSIGATLRTLCRSHSLPRFARFCASLLLVVMVEESKAQPNYEKIINEGITKGVMIGLGATTKPETDLIKTIIKPEGKGKIETKDGNVKIDTQNTESLKQAEEFRRNYKKSKECQEPETEEIRTQCTNEFINARKIFKSKKE